jgi:hypothetical protein
MRTISIILFSILISNEIFSTAQIPDLLIYKSDTVALYANPLEAYYNENIPRPDFKLGGCWSTACWRGYQAIWEIKNDSLFLNTIQDCCHNEEYELTDQSLKELKGQVPIEVIEKIKPLLNKRLSDSELDNELRRLLGERKRYKHSYEIRQSCKTYELTQKTDLNILFKDKVVNGKVFAFWFSGDLTVPKGEMIEYVHMGYMSKYEAELVLTIEKGKMIDSVEYDNKAKEIVKGYGVLQATAYSVVVPLDLINSKNGFEYTMTDTIENSNEAMTKSISALSKFNDSRKERNERIILVETTIDSLSNNLSTNYTFNHKKTEKLRWGTASWIDGQSKTNNELIRVFTISNINSQVIIEYKEKNIEPKDFKNIADYIIYSVQLMEFGY